MRSLRQGNRQKPVKKYLFNNISNFLWLSLVICLLYYLLVEDNVLHLSISAILTYANQFTKHGHLCVIGFLPIYLGMVIFGAAILLGCLRSLLSHCLNRWLRPEQ